MGGNLKIGGVMMMKRAMKVSSAIAVVFLMAVSPALAQKGQKVLKWYNKYYNKDKFNALAGADGILTQKDWTENRTKKEAAAFGNFRWDQAIRFDANGDGALDIEEAAAYKQAEKQALIENKTVLPQLYENQKLLKKHPDIAKKLFNNRKWLKEHPKTATAVYGNSAWLNKHPDVAKAVDANKKWLSQHPTVAKTLYHNREWLNNHPKAAKEAYKNRKFLNDHPEFSKDAYKHRDSLSKHPEATKKAYRAAKDHPHAARKAYHAEKRHPQAAKKAMHHPGKARQRMQRRRRNH